MPISTLRKKASLLPTTKGELWGTIRFEGFGGALFHAEKNNWATLGFLSH
jgi:hypothetical protein